MRPAALDSQCRDDASVAQRRNLLIFLHIARVEMWILSVNLRAVHT